MQVRLIQTLHCDHCEEHLDPRVPCVEINEDGERFLYHVDCAVEFAGKTVAELESAPERYKQNRAMEYRDCLKELARFMDQ